MDTPLNKRRASGQGHIRYDGYIQVGIKGRMCTASRIVAEHALGKPLSSKHPVHHANGDKADNRNESLVVCENQAYHALIEKRTRSFRATGRTSSRYCTTCKQWKDKIYFYETKRSTCKKCHIQGVILWKIKTKAQRVI